MQLEAEPSWAEKTSLCIGKHMFTYVKSDRTDGRL